MSQEILGSLYKAESQGFGPQFGGMPSTQSFLIGSSLIFLYCVRYYGGSAGEHVKYQTFQATEGAYKLIGQGKLQQEMQDEVTHFKARNMCM